MRLPHHRFRVWRSVVAFLVAFLATSWSRAQTSMRGLECDAFFNAVHWYAPALDEAGWRRIESIYEAYLDRAEAERKATDLSAMGDRLREGMWNDPEFAIRYWKTQRSIDERWEAVDRAMVEEVIASFGPGQEVAADNLRRWLEGQLASRFGWRFGPDFRAVGEQLRSIHADAADRAIIAEAAVELDRLLVPIDRKRATLTPTVMVAGVRLRSSMPPRPPEEDEAALQAWYAERGAAMAQTWTPLRDLDRESARVVDQWFDALRPRLSPVARRLATEVYFGARFQIGFAQPSLGTMVRRWLARTTLDPKAREAALARVAAWREANDKLMEQAVVAARAWWAQEQIDRWMPWPANGQPRSYELREELNRITERQSKLEEVAREEIAKLVGANEYPEQIPDGDITKLDDAGGLLFESGDDLAANAEEEEETDEQPDTVASEFPGRLPALLRSTDLAPMVGRLGLTLDQRATLETLQADQEAGRETEMKPLLEALEKLSARGGVQNEQGELDEAVPVARFEAYRRLRAKGREIEDAFFAGAAIVVPPEKSDTLAVWRIAHRLGEPNSTIRSLEDHWEIEPPIFDCAINVAWCLLASDLEPGDRAVAERIVASHRDALLAARDRLVDAELEYVEAGVMAEVRSDLASQRDADPNTDPGLRAALRRRQEAAEAFIAAATEAPTASKALSTELEAALPTPAWKALRLAIRKSTYPGIEGERQQMVRLFERVAKFPLDPERAARLAEVRERWVKAFDRETDRLAELGIQPEPAPDGTTMSAERFRVEQQWVMFRRDAGSEEARDAVARLLTPEERRTVPGLPRH